MPLADFQHSIFISGSTRRSYTFRYSPWQNPAIHPLVRAGFPDLLVSNNSYQKSGNSIPASDHTDSEIDFHSNLKQCLVVKHLHLTIHIAQKGTVVLLMPSNQADFGITQKLSSGNLCSSRFLKEQRCKFVVELLSHGDDFAPETCFSSSLWAKKERYLIK